MDQATTSAALEVIVERTANIERISTETVIKTSIQELLKQAALKEAKIRESTITVRHDNSNKAMDLIQAIESYWIEELKQAPLTYWQDKEKLYCQFLNKDIMEEFIRLMKTNSKLRIINKQIEPPNKHTGNYFTRKPVKLEILNVKPRVQVKKISTSLENIMTTSAELSEIREGKAHASTKARSLMFTANAEAFEIIFGQLDGIIQYTNATTNTQESLIVRVVCRPWQCRNCYKIGKHECTGKKHCANCGTDNHLTKDCKIKTRKCVNCGHNGHRSKDAHCSIYLREIAKELRRMDIPLNYLTRSEERSKLTRNLMYK